LAAARGTTLRHEWAQLNGDLPWQLVVNTVTWYNQYKAERELWDFNDMIARAEGQLPVDVLFVDEAQDTSTAQWALLRRIASHVPVVYFAGDDDQAVYHWSGADPYQLMRFLGDRRVLAQSYRLSRAVKSYADSLARRIQLRLPKPYAPRDEPGAVDWVNDLDKVDLRGQASYLLLARSNYQLSKLRHLARQQGVVYSLGDGKWSWSLPSVQAALTYEQLRRGKTVSRKAARILNAFLDHKVEVAHRDEVAWEHVFLDRPKDRPWFDALDAMPATDREYVRALRRSGESLTKPGRVRIGTVHSVKGAEADHVVLVTDVSQRVLEGMRLNPDAERRVQYVAATRARQTLTLIRPQTTTFWPL
jgi:DNA helicase-2/ATP-dependent DNA helicase PcrA